MPTVTRAGQQLAEACRLVVDSADDESPMTWQALHTLRAALAAWDKLQGAGRPASGNEKSSDEPIPD